MTAATLDFWARRTTHSVVRRAQNEEGVDLERFWARSSTDAVVQRAQNGRDGATP